MPDRSTAGSEAQFALLRERHWYSLVSAAPVPETGEAVNVAIVFGNGRANYLDFVRSLPRLSCLLPSAEIALYAEILEGCKDRIDRGIDPLELAALLGPQLFMRPPRTLYAEMSDQLVSQLRHRYRASPRNDDPADEDALVQRSRQQLDRVVRRTRFPQSMIQTEVTPPKLYEGRFKGLSGHRVPRLSLALRDRGRDLLLDSVAIEQPYQARDIRDVASRISQAFFMYDQYRGPIRDLTGTEVRTVGVLYPLPETAPAPLKDLFEFTQKIWTDQHARVITGSVEEIADQLRRDTDWVRHRDQG